jgi:methionine synthase II (cobalamin-independent)
MIGQVEMLECRERLKWCLRFLAWEPGKISDAVLSQEMYFLKENKVSQLKGKWTGPFQLAEWVFMEHQEEIPSK